jgi:Beta-propeller repeat
VSKPSAPKKLMPAGWVVIGSIIAVAAVAVLEVAFTGKPNRQRSSTVATVPSHPILGARTPATAAQDRIHARYSALPLAFEANEGQVDPQVKYVARGNGYRLSLTSKQAILSLPGRKRQSEVRDMMLNKRRGAAGVKEMLGKHAPSAKHHSSAAAVIRMNLLGANSDTELAAADLQRGKIHYFLGKDPSKWHSNIPLYGRVNYHELYPGVDLAFHGPEKRLEFDYLVSPGADTSRIALGFQGLESLHTDNAGNLVLATSAGSVQLNKPVAYQAKNGAREAVDAKFVLTGKNRVAFELGAYDHNRELVIDPTVTYSTYFGGDSADYASSIAVDASGDAFLAGATDSTTIPGNSGGTAGFDAFVTEIDPSGALLFTSIFGGTSGDEFPGGIAIDSQGIYISGTTDSSDFPVTQGTAQTVFLGGAVGGDNDAFAVKIPLDGSGITWGTYIAGSGSDSGLGIAVDSGHNVYVVGETFSANIAGAVVSPLPNGGLLNLGLNTVDDDGYIVKLNSTGTAYLLASYIGGSSGDLATGVALDGVGNIYVSGETISSDLPTTAGAVQTTCGTDASCNANASTSFDDAFIVSIRADLSNYNYVTYYGGSDVDDAFAIAADASGNAFVTGTTASTDLLYTGTTYQSTLLGAQNAFLLELNSAGISVTYNTYFGGDGNDFGLGVALDSSDNIYLTGQTTSSSTTFPLVNPIPGGGGSSDAFVSVFSISQGQPLFSTFLGGGGDEDQFQGSIGLDSAQNIYVSGDTDSGNGSTTAFPTTAAIDSTYGGGTCVDSVGNSVPCTDAFVAAYSAATTPDFAISATALSPSSVSAGGSATSTITVSPLNGYSGTVNLTCSVAGSGAPLPACSVSASTLTVTTTGAAAAIYRPSGIRYAMWLPVVGLSLIGMQFTSRGRSRKRLFGFLLLGLIMAALFFLPACGGGGSNGGGGGGGGGGCSGCTPAGTYTVTVTGTDSVNATLTHPATPQLSLTVN